MEEKEIPEPNPEITPDMVSKTFDVLESQGLVRYHKGNIYIPTESGWKLLSRIRDVKEEIVAQGHPHVKASHPSSIEITRSESLSKEGEGVIGVKANKACEHLSKELKNALKKAKRVEITFEVDGLIDKLTAFGSPALEMTHSESLVIRKDDFIDERTLAIMSDKSASELKKELIERLRNPQIKLKIILEVKS